MRMPAGPEWLLLGRTLWTSPPVPLGMPEVYLALKTGTVDGQENPLSIPGVNAAKFYEVTEQVVLTAHMIQPVFFNIARPVWDKLNDAQQKVLKDAAVKNAKAGSDARLADEESITAALKRSAAWRSTRLIWLRSVPRPTRSIPAPTSQARVGQGSCSTACSRPKLD